MRTAAGLAGALVALLVSACSEPSSARGDGDRSARPVTTAPATPPSPTGAPRSGRASAEPVPEERERPEPRRSFLSLPSIGLRDVPVVRYRGTPDDGPGTAIQNRGPTASPRGPAGGVGPGEVGNFIVTGHRTSHRAPFAELPAVGPGDRVRVESAGLVHVYEVTRTRSTSFRSRASLARQSAPVPGRPGVRPTRAMITLSTCATPEDHARGNYWSDRFGNPEHRIDKVGVLVATRPAR
jgi:sortase A